MVCVSPALTTLDVAEDRPGWRVLKVDNNDAAVTAWTVAEERPGWRVLKAICPCRPLLRFHRCRGTTRLEGTESGGWRHRSRPVRRVAEERPGGRVLKVRTRLGNQEFLASLQRNDPVGGY